MLVLSRRTGQKVIVTSPNGDRLEIEFLEIDNTLGKIRLGFTGPREFRILRGELETRRDGRQEAEQAR